VLAWYQRGGVHHETGAYDRAVADFTEVLRLRPSFAAAYHNRGLAFTAQGAHAQAIADFDRALELNPRFISAYHSRGLAYMGTHDHERAFTDHIEAVRLNPRSAAAYNKFAWLWIAWPDVRLREAQMGIELATRACELSGWDDWSCLSTLAAAFAEVARFEDAVQWATKALACAPEEEQGECRRRLSLYESGVPYRRA